VGLATLTVTVNNVAPTVAASGDPTIDEGGTFSGSGSFTDPGADTWTATVDYGDGSGVQPLALTDKTFALSHVYADKGTYTVTITLTDSDGEAGSDTLTVTVNNVAPILGAITAPVDPLSVNTLVTASASFTDAGVLDTHTAVWDWGDATTSAGVVTETNGSGSVSGTHMYTAAGVYTITLTLIDDDGGLARGTFQYIVAYDPDGGFVTGGGWINSPAGSYVVDSTMTGKANFGFVSKYLKGATVPTGDTEFQFKAGNLNFKSRSYEWLVVAGSRAQFKGSGTINGQGDYRFMLTAIDGQVNGGGGTDKFRIRIWDASGLVYDNQMNAPDSSDPTTVIGSGSIVIHK
jgi:PKD repeat protein